MAVDYDVVIGRQSSWTLCCRCCKATGSHGCPRGTPREKGQQKLNLCLISSRLTLTQMGQLTQQLSDFNHLVFTLHADTAQLQYICGVGRSNAVG